jgi:hypothetical protein
MNKQKEKSGGQYPLKKTGRIPKSHKSRNYSKIFKHEKISSIFGNVIHNFIIVF